MSRLRKESRVVGWTVAVDANVKKKIIALNQDQKKELRIAVQKTIEDFLKDIK